MASFSSGSPSSFPLQAPSLTTVPLPAPAPPVSNFFSSSNPSTTVAPTLEPALSADSFTPSVATQPAESLTSGLEATSTNLPSETQNLMLNPPSEKQAPTNPTKKGFLQWIQSPWGIATGVATAAVAGLGVWGAIHNHSQAKNPIVQLQRMVEHLNQGDLNEEALGQSLADYTSHLKTMLENLTAHESPVLEKLSSAIESVHGKHGHLEIAQKALLEGLGETKPVNLKGLSVQARQAIHDASAKLVEGLGKTSPPPKEKAGYWDVMEQAMRWLLHPHGEERMGIKSEKDLSTTAQKLLDALTAVDPHHDHFKAEQKALSAWVDPSDAFLAKWPLPPKKDTPLDVVNVASLSESAVLNEGGTLYNARVQALASKKTKERAPLQERLTELNKTGLGAGYGALSERNGFTDLEARLLPKVESEEKNWFGKALERIINLLSSD